jgi:hypothetical protein
MYGYQYPPPYFNPREFVKSLKDMEEWEDIKHRKREEKKKKESNGGRRKGFSTMEIFLLLTLSSPLLGPMYLYAVISGAKHISDMLQTLH